ncbi:MAG TPA: DUF305 domain-containing protein [Longimicrobium sp.]|nr:DUF305 domain-containing protein [Longimicrobium sp.]
MPVPMSGLKWAVLAGALAACASHPETPRPAASPADPAPHHHASELAATAGAGFTVADVRFMQHMIGHHAQALRMVAMVPGHAASEDVVRLAQKIDISQRDEIALMRSWLEERRQAVPDDAHPHAMMMPGMLTAEQLAQLDAARGREFDRLFLTFMTRHHEGALHMVRELFRTPDAGQDPDLFRFVTDVDADQRDEILMMERLLHARGD